MVTFDFDGEFVSGERKTFQTKSIALNTGQTITNARITMNTAALSSTEDFSWFLSADGGTTWEDATLNTKHTFTTTGNDLRMKVVGVIGALITIRQADGADYFMKVSYNE